MYWNLVEPFICIIKSRQSQSDLRSRYRWLLPLFLYFCVLNILPVFCTDTISVSQRLTASDGQSFDEFGYAVAVDGEYVVVGSGASDDDDLGSESGSAYVYKRDRSDDSWTQLQKLVASGGASSDYFGTSVAISGDYIFVGALNQDVSGSVYIFRRDNSDGSWNQVQKIVSSDRWSNDDFGCSVDVDEDYAIIGAYNYWTLSRGTSSGQAYIFERRSSDGRWIQNTKLFAFDGAADDLFGYDVAISGDVAFVAAYQDDNEKGQWAGSVYIFSRDDLAGSWIYKQKIVAHDGADGDRFGKSVSVSGKYAIVGAPWTDDDGTSSGKAYIFERGSDIDGTWTQIYDLRAHDALKGDIFGSHVGIAGDYAVVSASWENDNDGSAYVFERQSDGSWNQIIKLVASNRGSVRRFGYSVAISTQTTVVVGTDSESAYVYHIHKNGPPTSYSTILTDEPSLKPTEIPTMSVAPTEMTLEPSASPTEEPEIVALDTKVTASDRQAGDRFGYSVSVDNDYAIVGAPRNHNKGGSAYIFKRNRQDGSWTQAQKLRPSDTQSGDEFGSFEDGVAISGDFAIVGAYLEDGSGYSIGAAYIFQRDSLDDTWSQIQKLVPSDGANFDYFGKSVDIDGDYGYAIIGSYWDDDKGENSGSAYIFERRSSDGVWIQQSKLTPNGFSANEWFGYDVAISGKFAIVGAGDEWSSWIFSRDTDGYWDLEQKIDGSDASDASVYDHFGYSVSISGTYAIVGAYQHDGAASNSGCAYIFEREEDGTWIEVDKLVAHDQGANSGEHFGRSVSIANDYAVVGSHYYYHAGLIRSGSAYVFARYPGGSWKQLVKLVPSDPAEYGYFGASVSISSDTTVCIGARGWPVEAAYFYQVHADELLPSLAPSEVPEALTSSPTRLPTVIPTGLPTGLPTSSPTKHGTVKNDPHFETFNGEKHNFQGNLSELEHHAFGYMVPCDNHDLMDKMPLKIFGKHLRIDPKKKQSGVEYIMIELYDFDENQAYIVWISSIIHSWMKVELKSGDNMNMEFEWSSKLLYHDNIEHAIDLKRGKYLSLGKKFELFYGQLTKDIARLSLTIDGHCQMPIWIKYQNIEVNGRHAVHKVEFDLSSCYECYTCGLMGNHLCDTQEITM